MPIQKRNLNTSFCIQQNLSFWAKIAHRYFLELNQKHCSTAPSIFEEISFHHKKTLEHHFSRLFISKNIAIWRHPYLKKFLPIRKQTLEHQFSSLLISKNIAILRHPCLKKFLPIRKNFGTSFFEVVDFQKHCNTAPSIFEEISPHHKQVWNINFGEVVDFQKHCKSAPCVFKEISASQNNWSPGNNIAVLELAFQFYLKNDLKKRFACFFFSCERWHSVLYRNATRKQVQ